MGAQVVFAGDSLMFGEHIFLNSAYEALRRLCRRGAAIDRYRNVAVGGQTMDQMITAAASQVDALYSGSYSANILVVWGGTNDIATGGASAATLITRISTYCGDRQSAGWQVIVNTILPRSDLGISGSFETSRGTVNSSIVTNHASYADALADLADDGSIGDSGDEANKDYYSDNLHLTRNGWALVAGIWVPLIEALL